MKQTTTNRTVIVLIMMMLTTMTAGAWSGSGTEESPYQIKSTADLDQLATDVNSGTEHEGDYFVLTTDLTYSHTTDWNDASSTENNYTPIGGYNNNNFRYFKGHFDGQSHTISGIRIYQSGNEAEKRYAALFGQLSKGAEVKNVFLADARFTGYYYCGPIVGKNNGRVENCHVLSDVTVHAVTTDTDYHGGVVGYNDGTITGCTSAASITAAVSCKNNGGITGRGTGTVEDCIYFGSTVAGDRYVGAIIGYPASGSTVRNCYYINDGIASAIGDNTTSATVTDVRLATSDDFAVSGDTYTIGTAAGWSVMCAALYHNDTYNRFSGKTVRLGDDITVTRMAGGSGHEFTGTFDGGGYTLTVNITGTVQGTAPFCEIKGATIRNLVVTGSVAGKRHSAGLVGFARGDDASVENTIENCLVATDVSIMGDDNGYLGGIVGHGLKCKLTIRGCAFTGSLTSESNYTGGLQGWSDGNTLILENDIFAATSVNAANVGFHPIAFHNNNATTTATVTNVYYTVAPTCTTATRIAAAGKQARSITAGQWATVSHAGVANTYSASGITAYKATGASADSDPFIAGLLYNNNVLYAGSSDQLSLTLSKTATAAPLGYRYDGYTASAGTLSGTTLTMPDQDVTISAALAPIDWATVNKGDSKYPYMIYNKDQLLLLAYRVNGTNGETANDYSGKYFKLGADITFTHPDNEGDDYAENYEAIGGCYNSTDRWFKGDFDGDGHTVSGIRIRKDGTDDADLYQGLFGQINRGANIHDVHLTDARIKGYNYVGGIVGFNFGTISGCTVTNSHITASEGYGTICGYDDGTLTNNYYHGCTVNGTAVTSGKGCGGSDITYDNGALPAYHLTLGDGVSTTALASAPENGFVYNGVSYYREGLALPLACTEGYSATYYVGSTALDGTTYTVNATDCDVTINATLRSDGLQHEVSYMTADGTAQTAQAVALDGTETSLAAGWYFMGKNISYNATLTLSGNVNLILADGCEMKVGESGEEISGNGIKRDGDADLTIYGQTAQTGTLSVYVSGDYWNAIGPRNLTINGGNVIASAEGKGAKGLKANGGGDITINRGNVNATATGTGARGIASDGNVEINGGTVNASGDVGIQSNNNLAINGGNITASSIAATTDGSVAINGGNVTASSISTLSGTITLGWTRPADRITASSIRTDGGTVAVADGKALTDGSGNIYTGTLTASVLSGFAAETTLQPCLALADAADNTAAITDHAGQTLAVALSGRTLYKDGSWNTLCLPFDVSTISGPLSDDNVQAMILNNSEGSGTGFDASTGVLTLNFNEIPTSGEQQGVIPAGTPFIIRWGTPDDNPGTALTDPVFQGVTIDNSDAAITRKTQTSNDGTVSFKGTYASITYTEENKSILFVGGNNNLYWPTVGFSIGAQRAYFELNDGQQARNIVLNFFDEQSGKAERDNDNATGIHSTTNFTRSSLLASLAKNFTNLAGAWYTLDGRKLSGTPTAPGIYVKDGHKVAIK